MKKLTVYCARPMSGLSFNVVNDYYHNIQTELTRIGYNVLHPMCGKAALKQEGETLQPNGYVLPVSTNHAIFQRDRWMVRQADVIFANLIGATAVSIGTMMELAWGFEMGKHNVVALEKGNPHNHCFVAEAAHLTYPTYEEAIEYLKLLVQQGF